MNRRLAWLSAVLLLAGCAQNTSSQQEGATTDPDMMPDGMIYPPSQGETTAPKTTPTSTPSESVLPEPEVTLPPKAVEPPPLIAKPETPKPKPKPQPVVRVTPDGKLILGREEWVMFPQANNPVKATVDEGAAMSSIGVTGLTAFERDGKEWVKFKTGGKQVELPVERWMKPKNGQDREAVVKLRAKLGDLNELTEFVLKAGKGIVLGVNFIRDVAIVDTKRQFVQPKVK
ncbi:RimK/LysX family protein [Photobacterium aphoticum]|nr:RimK/LysX family protein [Photobacterium aphoticum]PSU59477.1 hypothetical protein C9I90_03105 [Photobacterium aphoticum]